MDSKSVGGATVAVDDDVDDDELNTLLMRIAIVPHASPSTALLCLSNDKRRPLMRDGYPRRVLTLSSKRHARTAVGKATRAPRDEHVENVSTSSESRSLSLNVTLKTLAIDTPGVLESLLRNGMRLLLLGHVKVPKQPP